MASYGNRICAAAAPRGAPGTATVRLRILKEPTLPPAPPG